MTDIQNENVDDRQQGGIQVIARMSAIMRALSTHAQPSGMSLAAIANAVGLPRSTVQRIVNALVAEHIVEPAGPTGFRIGPALGQMLYQTHSDVVPIMRPYAEQLSMKLQETVCLAHLQMQKLHMVEAIVGEQILRVVPLLGIAPPLQITAAGKALLARMSDQAILEWLANQPEATPSPQALMAEINVVRQQGFAQDQDEVLLGISSIAACISTYRGDYALAIVTPTARMQQQAQRYQRELLMLCDAMEKLLGIPTTML